MNDQTPLEMPAEIPAMALADDKRRRTIAALVVALILCLAIGTSILVWRSMERAQRAELNAAPPTPPPAVEPLELKQVAPEEARKINADVPLVIGPVPAAKPFHISGNQLNVDRAIDCLASAIYYEAGAEKPDGQKAVAQVVLNRLRHPAFPKTVCGVVYQGSTRTTGCQFSYTCDGSMRRVPSASVWASMRKLARSALTGDVYKPVGLATHYHTDWVVPYWSAKLDKIRVEATHLFFRWTGWWGTPPAFRGSYAGSEPQVTKLAALSPAHAQTLEGEVALDAGGPTLDALGPTGPVVVGKPSYINPAGDFIIFLVDKRSDPGILAAQALSACGGGPYCKVMMWTDRSVVPTGLPISDGQLSKLAFSYLRNSSNGYEKALWNCEVFKRPDPAQCMKSRAVLGNAASGSANPVIVKDRTAETAPWTRQPPTGLTAAEVEDDGPAPLAKPAQPPVDRAAPRRRPGSGGGE